ncbi:MAG: hypothetical protein HY429_03430 [Candidatus Levybacteria bacterium]|nr:hypothetical protein [Candidatus Levybacteria bacterium]
MRRYKFLTKEDVFEALNRLREAFLAAKDGKEVEEIIKGILTHDEKIKIGRRILIAEYVVDGFGFDEISKMLKVGKATITSVMKNLDLDSNWLELIQKRSKKIESEYAKKKYETIGGSTLVFKKKQYTGFTRKKVLR